MGCWILASLNMLPAVETNGAWGLCFHEDLMQAGRCVLRCTSNTEGGCRLTSLGKMMFFWAINCDRGQKGECVWSQSCQIISLRDSSRWHQPVIRTLQRIGSVAAWVPGWVYRHHSIFSGCVCIRLSGFASSSPRLEQQMRVDPEWQT